MRETVSIKIIQRLLEEGDEVTAFDSVAMPNAEKIFKDQIKYAVSTFQCLKNADCCMIVTNGINLEGSNQKTSYAKSRSNRW